MSPHIPPIESGYRGSRTNTTPGPNNLTTNNSSSHSSINNSNPGRTTYVAINIQTYFSLPNPYDTTEHQDHNQGHRSHRQQRHSARDRCAHRGIRWSESKAIHRFRAQSAQFDTSTTLFLKRARPSASQLIFAIHSESRSTKYSKKRSRLAAVAYQISQHEQAAQNQISLQLGNFTRSQVYGQAPQEKPDDCIRVIMENFNSLGFFNKGTKINSLNKLCRKYNTDVLAGCET
jgi:hypothetical protein